MRFLGRRRTCPLPLASNDCRRREAAALGPSTLRLISYDPMEAGGWRKRADVGIDCRPNGLKVKLRGQGPRPEADAAHGVHACESRDAGRAPPSSF